MRVGRRHVLAGAAALAAAPRALVAAAPVAADPAVTAALRPVFGDRVALLALVTLVVPEVAENAASVQVTVGFAGPEPPKRLVLVAPGNPNPLAAEYRFGPRAARPEVTTRLRLAGSQSIVAGAEMADGTLWAASAAVAVTAGACVDVPE